MAERLNALVLKTSKGETPSWVQIPLPPPVSKIFDTMEEFYTNQNNYGIILLRDNYEDALAGSEEIYDKQCERVQCPTPKSQRTTKYLLGIKENILSGQVGLYIPPKDRNTKNLQ